MSQQPTIRTSRLCLRPLRKADAAAIQELAGNRAVSEMTLLIPHPYPRGVAQQWIADRQEDWRSRTGAVFGIAELGRRRLCGAIGLRLNADHAHAELGYWLGVPFWGRGYATEAAQTVVRFSFETLKLHRVFAQHFRRNPASGRVLQKAGMRHEGCLRQHVCRWDRFEDVECYGILREEWDNSGPRQVDLEPKPPAVVV
jgi:ribosomal-protein-alanine N-acetyltransferase